MTKFESIGVYKQLTSTTPEEAEMNYNQSCTLCCMRNYDDKEGHRCKACLIREAHKLKRKEFGMPDLDELERED